MERKFYLFKRGKVFYCQLKNPKTGKPLPAKSTGECDRTKAEYVAYQWLVEGVPQAKTEDPRSVANISTIDEILRELKKIEDLSAPDVKRFLNYFKSKNLSALPVSKGAQSKPFLIFC